MTEEEIESIADKANMILMGYAYTVFVGLETRGKGDEYIEVINLNDPREPVGVTILDLNGNMIETNMNNTELDTVTRLYNKNKEYLR